MAQQENFYSSRAFLNLSYKHLQEEIASDEFNFGSVNDHLPYSDLRQWLSDDSFILRADRAFNVYRLSKVRSLSFLSARIDQFDGNDGIHHDFRHDRYDHSLVAAMVMDAILRRNKISGRDYHLGVLAALTHDLATPAGGDAVKYLDPENLHEETHWQEMLTDDSMAFLSEHDLHPDDVQAVITNEGPLGEILDLADRLTYTMKDVYALVGYLAWQPSDDVSKVLHGDRLVGNLYRDIELDPDSGRPFCNDPGRLEDFLKLRAFMHYNLYLNPATAGRDWVVAKFAEPFYAGNNPPTEEKPLTPSLLRTWTDEDFIQFLCQKYVLPTYPYDFFYHTFSTWRPSILSFATQEEAEKEFEIMQRQTQSTVLSIVSRKGFSTGEQYLTKDDNGDIRPFKDVRPQAAELLSAVSDATRQTHLFYVKPEDQSQIANLVRQERAKGNL